MLGRCAPLRVFACRNSRICSRTTGGRVVWLCAECRLDDSARSVIASHLNATVNGPRARKKRADPPARNSLIVYGVSKEAGWLPPWVCVRGNFLNAPWTLSGGSLSLFLQPLRIPLRFPVVCVCVGLTPLLTVDSIACFPPLPRLGCSNFDDGFCEAATFWVTARFLSSLVPSFFRSKMIMLLFVRRFWAIAIFSSPPPPSE